MLLDLWVYTYSFHTIAILTGVQVRGTFCNQSHLVLHMYSKLYKIKSNVRMFDAHIPERILPSHLIEHVWTSNTFFFLFVEGQRYFMIYIRIYSRSLEPQVCACSDMYTMNVLCFLTYVRKQRLHNLFWLILMLIQSRHLTSCYKGQTLSSGFSSGVC